jgi:arylsulfatase A-like enzyme
LACKGPEPPNVVVFVVDTVRADALSANGHPVELTPNIDGLATSGVNFTAAYSHSTWTKPSIASLFTSTYSDRHRIRSVAEEEGDRMVASGLRPELQTMAERFRDGGFATAAFVNQIHLQSKFGFDQGFDHYQWSTGKNAHKVNTRLVRWLDTEPTRPVFVYIHYLDPHWPYRERVDSLRSSLGDLGVHPRPPADGSVVDKWVERAAPGSISGLRTRYDHGVAFADEAVGNALHSLAQRGFLDDAVVVVTSDHGEGFMEHGRLLHGYAPYEEVSRVPLILAAPQRLGLQTGVVDSAVGLIDVLPTLLELAGLDPEGEGLQGRSLVPLMRGESLPPRPVYLETAGIRSLTDGDRKLIRYPGGESEFFDLRVDPKEQQPLPCEAACQALADELESIVLLAEASEDDSGDQAVELDEDDLERLRTLGYLNN